MVSHHHGHQSYQKSHRAQYWAHYYYLSSTSMLFAANLGPAEPISTFMLMIWSCNKPVNTIQQFHEFQNDINLIVNFVATICLQLNVTKTKYMHISRKCAQVLLPPPKVDNVPLEMVECYKYLGMIISNDMSWAQQIQAVTCKSKRLLGLLYQKYYMHCNSS